MSNRYIPTEIKVQVMEKCLQLVDVEETASQHGVHPNSIYYWFDDKIKANLREILANDAPGPKAPLPAAQGERPAASPRERPTKCDRCGGTRIWKNGVYSVINWVWLLTSQHLRDIVHLRHQTIRLFDDAVPAIDALLELAVREGTPTTTKGLEGKNGIFKPFSLIAESFRLATGQNFFAGVALMENFKCGVFTKAAVPSSAQALTWTTWVRRISSQRLAWGSHKYPWLSS